MNANHMTIGFIGLGLIGGSIAKTIRRIHPDSIIYGFDTDIDSLKMAKEDGTLTQYFETLDTTFSSCDIIFLCAPVSNNIEYLIELKGIISESCLLTDVGSVKEPIQSAIKELGMESNFIGGHPMVGSEKSGYAHANDHLLENAYYFLTPSERTLFQLTTKFSSFIQGLGALAVSLKPEEHDFTTAAISHVPHIVAADQVHLVRRAAHKNGSLNQRSQDVLAANNWNVCQYAVLMHMLAQVCDMRVGELVHVIADAHIYDRHVPIVKELIERPQYDAPKFWLNPDIKDFYQFTTDDIKITDYVTGEQIKDIPIAV